MNNNIDTDKQHWFLASAYGWASAPLDQLPDGIKRLKTHGKTDKFNLWKVPGDYLDAYELDETTATPQREGTEYIGSMST